MDRQIIDIRDHNEFTDCQKCGKNLRNGPVLPASDRKYLGDFVNYSALEGLKMDVDSEMITHWKCPHCGFMFPRFS